MKECPNCGARVQGDMVLCSSCGIDMRKAADRLGRDYYIPAGREIPADDPPLFSPAFDRQIPLEEEESEPSGTYRYIPAKKDRPPSRLSASLLGLSLTQRTYDPSSSRTYVTQTRNPTMISNESAPISWWFILGELLPGIGIVGVIGAGILSLYDLIIWFQIALGLGIVLIWLTIYGDAKNIGAGNVNNVGNFLTKVPPVIWLVGSLIGWPWVPLVYVFSRDDIWQAYLRGRDFGY